MESISFLTVDNDSISWNQALKYLKDAGLLQRTLLDILRQYILEKEMRSRNEIEIPDLRIDQAIMDFRLQNQLIEPKTFQAWLKTKAITYEEFQSNITFAFKVEKFKDELTEPKLEAYFSDRKPLLDRVVLSRIILSEQKQAENLKELILADRSKFEQIALEQSLADDRVVKGMMGAISCGQMPELLRTAVNLASPGEIIGPLEIDGRYCLFRVEQFLPVALEGPLKQELKNQLFEQWFQEKLQKMNVKMELQ